MQVWKIEDFLAKWTKATAGKSDDPIAVILTQEIDNYTLCLPHLKSCLRGAGWEDTHWNQLFGLLGMKTSGPAAVSKETVTLTHFLEKADLVVKHADVIKSLDAQAQGEAVIRKALTELKMWGMAREFTFTESTQSVSGYSACCSGWFYQEGGEAGAGGTPSPPRTRTYHLISSWRRLRAASAVRR